MQKCLLTTRLLPPKQLPRTFTNPHRHHSAHSTRNKDLLEALTALSDETPSNEPLHTSSNAAPSPAPLDLPQSPLTDPILNAARRRWREPKPAPDEENLSFFQRKLRKNPYALALASPVRTCILTSARLPSAFLLEFGLATHPATGAKWHLPTLAAETLSPRPRSGAPTPESVNHTPIPIPPDNPAPAPPEEEEEEEEDIEETEERADPTLPTPHPSEDPPLPTPPQKKPATLSHSFLLSTHLTLTHTTAISPHQYQALLPFRWKADHSIRYREIIWREDMAEFVLDLLRRKVVLGFEKALRKGGGYVSSVQGWGGLRGGRGVGCVLALGRAGGDWGGEGGGEGGGKPQQQLPKYAMVACGQKLKPVFDLGRLLGGEYVEGLRRFRPGVFGGEVAVVKAKNATVGLVMELWKLEGFLAQGKRGGR